MIAANDFSRKPLRLVFCVVACLAAACSPAPEPPQVTANQETLQGEWTGKDDTVAVFRGIPFAAPPVGDRRWRAPAESPPRDGLQQATEFAPACPQGDYIVDWYIEIAAAFGQPEDVVGRPVAESEDCLYLNVWTPEITPSTPMPVMVYVHGGANRGGWSYEPNYLGHELAARGVVVVSITYRLGPLGFFSHPALPSDEANANFALLDIRQAFEWVKQNIPAFGGDPGNVTGFGESSGAGNLIDLALVQDDDQPLLHRVIAQSAAGSLRGRRSLEQEQAAGESLIRQVSGETTISAEAMRAIPAGELVAAVDEVLPDHYFEAVVDGVLMTTQPIDLLDQGRGSRIDLITGTNADEWLMYLDADISAQDVDDWVGKEAPEFSGSLKRAVESETNPRKALDRLETAKNMLCPSRYLAASISQQGGQAFVYYFTRRREGEGGDALGAYHGAELPYVFGTHDNWLPTDDIDWALASTMMDFWVEFARDGRARTNNQPGWPIYSDARAYVMEFGDEVRINTAHDTDLCRYLGPERNSR